MRRAVTSWLGTALLFLAACGGGSSQPEGSADEKGALPSLQATSPGWSRVADEWQTFTLAAATTVRYGAGSAWVERALPAGSHACTNDYFGNDPQYGTVKQCEVASSDSSSGSWAYAADEWGSFSVAAAARVRYGQDSTWHEVDVPAGHVACTNAFFGHDPLFGTVKRCEVWVDSAAPPPSGSPPPTAPPPPAAPPSPSGWSQLAAEWGSFTLAAPGVVRYGANDAWVERSLSAGAFSCTNDTFGTDPLYGTVKRCELGSSGGGSSGGGAGGGGGSTSTGSPDRPATRAEAARFLTQATFGPTDADIDRVIAVGYSAWVDEQFAKPASSHLGGYRAINNLYVGSGKGASIHQTGTLNAFWRFAVTGQDQLRQRVAFALSQIMVISMQDSVVGDQGEPVSAYFDMLADKGLGNYRDLLHSVATHPLMGAYLSHLKNRKADPNTGRVPDENFAREVMQLFTIGVHELNPDGTTRTNGGVPIETYTNQDIAGLAKVFTGYSWYCGDLTNFCFVVGRPTGNPGVVDWYSPMVNYPQYFSEESKTFLRNSIPARTPGSAQADLALALDTLSNHANVGPFIGRQLIQRLVTSNPSPTYVADVARVFANNGSGQRGDMKAVVKAILLHPEARVMSATSGKVREPILRVTAFMRTLGVVSRSGYYWMNNTDNPGTDLGQSPMRSPSVFNFYRPGYAAPGSTSAAFGLVAPELQLVHETSSAGYVNFMRDAIDWGFGWDLVNTRQDFVVDLEPYKPLAEQPSALVDALTGKLLYAPVPAELKHDIVTAVQSIAIPTPNSSNTAWVNTLREWRVKAAMLLVVASPEYQVQR